LYNGFKKEKQMQVNQFGRADFNGWDLILNNGTWDQSAKPSVPNADPPAFSFPNTGPNGTIGLLAHAGKYFQPPQLPHMPVGGNANNTYMLFKSLNLAQGGKATLKARCSLRSYQYLSVYISTDMQGWGSEAGKLWNMPFPGKPAPSINLFQDLEFDVPAGPCEIRMFLNNEGGNVTIVDFYMPED
jgi:hypothetical protein